MACKIMCYAGLHNDSLGEGSVEIPKLGDTTECHLPHKFSGTLEYFVD